MPQGQERAARLTYFYTVSPAPERRIKHAKTVIFDKYTLMYYNITVKTAPIAKL